MTSDSFQIQPIGYVECRPRYRYEAPRQGVLTPASEAVIRLVDDPQLLAGLQGLEGFERIWVVFVLHLNEGWQPLVQPPHEDAPRQGVFATRSPHRPNRIGLSCVEQVKIDGNAVHVRSHDLLDRTPVIDLKPYLPYADAFPDARTGWLEEIDEVEHHVNFTPAAMVQAEWILAEGGLDVANFAQIQLRTCPTDTVRKRITPAGDDWVIAYRTWRLHYHVDPATRTVTIDAIASGYTDTDLENPADPHGDKDVHRRFCPC